MKVKLFVAREIQHFELGIFSFSSYVYCLTRGFIASTRAFNLLTRAFNLTTCAFNLPTRAFTFATRVFSLLTCGFELVTRRLELVIYGFELVTRGFEPVTRGFELITLGINCVDKFEQKDMKKIRPVKNTWYDWLINYISELIRKRVGGFKDRFFILFKTNTPKQMVHGRGKKLSKQKAQKKKKKERSYRKEKKLMIN